MINVNQQKISMKKRWLWLSLEKPCRNVISSYCRFVARYPIAFIIIPVLLTFIFSLGILHNFTIIRGVHYLYTPLNSQWKFEDRVFQDGWASKNDRFYPGKDIFRKKSIYLLMVAKDGGNILRATYANQFIHLLDWITSEVAVTEHDLRYTYRNICLKYRDKCFENSHARFIADIYRRNDQDRFNVTYPIFKSQFSAEPIDLSQTLGGVRKDVEQRIQLAKAWVVFYQLQQNTKLTKKLSLDFEYSLSKRIEENTIPTSLLNVYIFHSDIFETELAEGSQLIAPRFAYTFMLLIVFSILCTFNTVSITVPNSPKKLIIIDWLSSKPILGFIGVLVCLLAIISAIGLLRIFNVPFADIVTLMPFLSLTVGIDDTFLILASWKNTNVNLSVEERIETSMQHVALSVAITSITDIIAFLVGAIAPLPAVIYFCYYSAAAIAFTFCYLLTTFVAFLAIFGQWEKLQRNNLFGIKTIPIYKYADASLLQRIFNMGGCDCNDGTEHSKQTYSKEKMQLWNNPSTNYQLIRNCYAPLITNRLSQIAALAIYCIYLVVAMTATQKLKIGFDMINLLRDNSPSKKFLEMRDMFFDDKISALEIAVMKPPKLNEMNDRIKFMKALEEFEATNCSIGRNTTDFWYFAYERFMNDLGFGGEFWEDLKNDKEEFERNIPPFLMANEKYHYDILLNDNESIEAFRLSTQIDNIPTYSTHHIVQCAKEIRGVAKRYEKLFNITTYSPLWPLADQLDIIWPQTLQDLYISIAVIVPISLLMIPQPFAALVIALTVGSIAIGLIGFMAFWDVNLDAISMITIAMSVGFSVDFAVHITYSYMVPIDHNLHDLSIPYERLIKTLEIVGWPVLQTSISILLGILPLATVNLYVVRSCLKTVLLIILIGTLHALLFLPLFLMQMHSFYLWIRSTSRITFSS